MKHVIRLFALLVVCTGFAAAALAPSPTKLVPGHQAPQPQFPAPGCVPEWPICN